MIKRIDHQGKRYYLKMENGILTAAPSVTTVIDDLFSQDDFVRIKKLQMGELEFTKWWAELADKGTALHHVMELLIKFRSEQIEPVIDFKYIFYEFRINAKYKDRFMKDVLAVDEFVRNLMPLQHVLSEKIFINEVDFDGKKIVYGGAIDLITSKDAINFDVYDLKSGHYAEASFKHKLQLSAYANFVQKSYGTVEKIKLVCPKDWRKAPSYNEFAITDTEDYLDLFLTGLKMNYEKYDLKKQFTVIVSNNLDYKKISYYDLYTENFDNLEFN